MLVLDFSICQSSDCTEFIFSELTGTYNATTNSTGWGAPNATLASVTTPVNLVVTLPDGTTSYTINLLSTTPAFPVDTLTSNEVTFDMSNIGGTAGDSIPDGVYTFVYTVTTSGGTYTQTATVAFYCQVSCCVYTMFKDLDIECDCCDDDRKRITDAYLMLKGLIYSANCGNISQFNSILEELQRLCTNTNCSNCH